MGARIDNLFCDFIELLLTAQYANKETKSKIIAKACVCLDSIKYFLKISWEMKYLDNNKYIELSLKLDETGKMLGGWKKQNQYTHK